MRDSLVVYVFRGRAAWVFMLLVVLCSLPLSAMAQVTQFERSVVSGGMVRSTTVDSVRMMEADSLAHLKPNRRQMIDPAVGSVNGVVQPKKERRPLLSDSMSLSGVSWSAAVMPGYGQIYNKQYWKLPVLYGTLATGTTLYIHENRRFRGYRDQFDAMLVKGLYRTDEMDILQTDMIRSNTRRQIYLGATAATYLYSIADAALHYSTNDVSDIKRATTLATIFPGAGQLYNKSYWKVPFVVGGFASMLYVVDWNSRGYTRFSKAYRLRYAYDVDPSLYPNGSPDEFSGRYPADFLRGLRDSYRRNRDLSIIIMAGLYALQIIDAHVDAHFKDYDISDDLTIKVAPVITPSSSGNSSVGMGMNVNF